jgi:uncharacterized protein YcbX
MSSKDILSNSFLSQETSEYVVGSPRVAGLVYFPGKSMAPHFLAAAYIDNVGIRPSEQSTLSDRQFMLAKPNGQMESQRTLPTMARLHIAVADDQVSLEIDGDIFTFTIKVENKTSVKVHATDGIAAVDQGDDVAAWLKNKFGKEIRLVRQVDDKPRRRSEVLPAIAHIDKVLRLQDSSPVTGLSHASLQILNEQLAWHEWNMEALSFRMNFLFAGEFNEHEAVGKFLRFGEGPTADYLYVWRPKERCPLPANDQLKGELRGNEGSPKERMSYVYQRILKTSEMHDALAIPNAWRQSGDGVISKAMLGIDMFPINRGTIRLGDSIAIVDQLPENVLA